MPPPLIAYVRVSRQGDREDGRFHSPTEQDERARSFAASKGLAVSETVEDIDVSGGTHPKDRPGMAHALAEIRAGRAGGLVAFSLDRLSRDPNHGDWLVREITSHGGIVTTPDMPESIDTPTGEFTFGLLLGAARLYRRTAAERLVSAKERATRSGILVSKHVPLGYTRDEQRRMVLDPDMAPVVAELFQRRVAGASWQDLARFLDERTGRTWSRSAVRHMLRSPIYRTGRIEQSGVVSEWESGAIVDASLWFAAQSPKSATDGRTSKGKWLLSGLIRCDSCGRALTPWRPSQARSKARRYRCVQAGCTERVSVAAEAAEALVKEEAFAVDLKLVARQPEAVDLGALEEALAKAESRLAQMLQPEAQDALGDAWPATAKLRREERDEAARVLGEARADAGMPGAGGKVLRLGHVFDDLDAVQAREALRWVFSEVRASKVPPGQPPSLTYTVRATRPWGTLEMRPPGLKSE